MALAQLKILSTLEEYLALEREAEVRHEYLDGEIYEMAGESLAHGYICTNLAGQLYTQLRGTPCGVLAKDMKVLSGPYLKTRRPAKGLFSYPDLVVVCGEPRFHDERRDVLLNPTVIIEVLSPSTEAFDRGAKFRRYRTHLPSLTDYMLIAQELPFIDHYQYQDELQRWVLTSAVGLEGSLYIAPIDCTLRLADVYDRVEFPDEEFPDETMETDDAEPEVGAG